MSTDRLRRPRLRAPLTTAFRVGAASIGAACAVWTSAAHADEPAPAPAPVALFTATFDKELHQRGDLTLQGTHAERHIDVAIPRAWSLEADPLLRLQVSHSASLLAARSHLTVLLNGQALASYTLDASNESSTTIEVRLPRAALQDFNDLSISAIQHYTDDCEDPFDPALWTRVSRASMVAIPYRVRPVTDGLEAWPYPVIDPRGFGPVAITPVLAHAPLPETARAAGTVAVALGRLASYRTVQVAPAVEHVADAKSVALLVGTVAELPELAGLVGNVTLAPTDGLVAVLPNPADPTLPVLVVTGGGPEGLLRAAQALAGQDREPALAGPWTVVHALSDALPPPNAESPLPVVGNGAVPLSDLGFKGVTVRGYYPDAIHVPVRLEGDSLIRPGGGTIDLHYAYSAQLDTRLSAMEVRLDGLTLRSVPLDRVEGSEDGEVAVTLPEEVVTPASQVDVVFHLFPREYDACRHVADHQIWGSVFASSTLEIPRDHMASMPDLARLRYGAWPLTGDPSTGAVIAVLPDVPGAGAWSAGLELAAALGRASYATAPAFRLELATGASFSEDATAHFVVLADGTAHALYSSLASAGSLSLLDTGADRSLFGGHKAALEAAQVSAATDTIEQVLQPANHERSVLVLHEGQPGGLQRLVDTVIDPARVSLLHGNAAVVAADGGVRVLDIADRQMWGRLPIATEARMEVRRSWWVLGAALVLSAVVVALLVRRWARPKAGV